MIICILGAGSDLNEIIIGVQFLDEIQTRKVLNEVDIFEKKFTWKYPGKGITNSINHIRWVDIVNIIFIKYIYQTIVELQFSLGKIEANTECFGPNRNPEMAYLYTKQFINACSIHACKHPILNTQCTTAFND